MQGASLRRRHVAAIKRGPAAPLADAEASSSEDESSGDGEEEEEDDEVIAARREEMKAR